MDIENETLTRVQMLHHLIDEHPMLSGLMTDEFHRHLDLVIKNAHHLDSFDKSEFRRVPSDRCIEKLDN